MDDMATGRDWQRLADCVRERRADLDVTQEDVRAVGGPSTATMRLIEGALQESYQPIILRRLEDALKWERGSVRRILAGGDPVLAPDALTPVPLPAAPEPETPDPGDDAGVSTAVIRAAVPATVRQIWTRVRQELAATPAGRTLFTDPAQSRAWPPGSAPLDVTEEAAAVLDTMRDTLFPGQVENAASRLVKYTWPERVMVAAASLDVLGQRPTKAVRRAG